MILHFLRKKLPFQSILTYTLFSCCPDRTCHLLLRKLKNQKVGMQDKYVREQRQTMQTLYNCKVQSLIDRVTVTCNNCGLAQFPFLWTYLTNSTAKMLSFPPHVDDWGWTWEQSECCNHKAHKSHQITSMCSQSSPGAFQAATKRGNRKVPPYRTLIFRAAAVWFTSAEHLH